MYYSESTIKNLLQCAQCLKQFGLYDSPKILECNNTICSECAQSIINLKCSIYKGFKFENKKNVPRWFKCKVCLDDHEIPNIDFISNDLALKLIHSIPTDVEQLCKGKFFEVKTKIEAFRKLLGELDFTICNCEFILTEHCCKIINEVQLKKEKEQIERAGYKLLNNERSRINHEKYFDVLFNEIEIYKNDCLLHLKNSTKIKTSSASAKNFFEVVEKYLKQSELNEEQLSEYSDTATIFSKQLTGQLTILVKNIFMDQKITFNESKIILEYDSKKYYLRNINK